MEVVMVKRVQRRRSAACRRRVSRPGSSLPRHRRSRSSCAPATIQLARSASGFRVDKKGAIDLVTEVDLECERMCRAVIAERFPDHDVLAEELSRGPRRAARVAHRWVFDPLDGTTNYAHGLPIFCASLALEIDGRADVGAVYDPTRQELFTAERGEGAFLNGEPLRVSAAGDADRRAARHRLSLRRAQADRRSGRAVRRVPRPRARRAPARVGGARPLLRRRRPVRRLLGAASQAVGRRAGALIVEEAGGRVTGMDGSPFDPRPAHLVASNGHVHDEMLDVIRDVRRACSKRTN